MSKLERGRSFEQLAGRATVLILPSPLVDEDSPARAIIKGLNPEDFRTKTATPGDKDRGYTIYNLPVSREAVKRLRPVIIVEDPLKGSRAYDLFKILPQSTSSYSPIVIGTFVTPLGKLGEPIGISHVVGEVMRRARFPRQSIAGFVRTAMNRLDGRVVFDQEALDSCRTYYPSLDFEFIPLADEVEQARSSMISYVNSLQDRAQRKA